MHTKATDNLLNGITFNDNLPISWEVVADMPSEGEQHREHRINEELLQNLLLQDDGSSQDSDEVETASGLEHFKRLETRLDLLLSLVTQMMTSNGDMPSKRAIALSSGGIRIQAQDNEGSDLRKDALLKIQLFVDPQFPRPLTLWARLIDAQPQNFTVKFCPLEERLQDLLDKYVFRQHRRAIALARKSEKS